MPVEKRKSKRVVSNQAVSELFPPPRNYCALSRKPLQADRSTRYEDLKEYGRLTGFAGCSALSNLLPNQLPMPSIEEIIFPEEFL